MCDFSQDELDRIIRTRDEDMKGFEFKCIFQSYLPAGTYEKSVYFLPPALQYIREQHDDSDNVLDNLLIWSAKSAYDELKNDNIGNIGWSGTGYFDIGDDYEKDNISLPSHSAILRAKNTVTTA